MTREDRFNWVLNKEEEIRQQRLKRDLLKSKYENKMFYMNGCIAVISAQMTFSTLGLFYSCMRDD